MPKILLKRLSILVLAFGLVGLVGYLESHPIHSASLTTVSVTLSNPRLSFRGALGSGNTEGSSVVTINTTQGAYPSTSSAQLVQGDTVLIGESSSLGSYTVASTSSLSTFTISSALAAGDIDAGDDVISTQSADHTVRFSTANAIANGRFRILVPALEDDGAAADGIPDGGFFDFGTSAPTVTCPDDVNGDDYDFVAGVATASAITIDGTSYHAFECAYSGAGAVGTDFDNSSQDAILISSLINPAPKSNHTTGTADSHKVIVQHLDSNLVVQDTTTVSVGVIEAVRVTASVPAQITFQILGLAAGTSACGVTTDVTTTASSVPFGEVSISAFNDAAQSMNVSTNAVNGFAVTAIENDQLGLNGAACAGDPTITSNTSCIADARGDNGTMADGTSDEWNTSSNKGFAYSLHDVNTSTTEAFSYNESARTFSARQFADAENSGTAQTIFSSTGPADNHNLYVCYRLIPGVTTAAGNYENNVTYTATATF
ncbi:MAG TPA: hypothetical protein VF209_02460 [Patescibacteria group bacterium]